MTPPLGRQRFLRNKLFIPAVAALILIVIVSLALLISASLRAEVSALGALALLFIFAVSMITALATTEVIPWRELTWLHIRQPKILGALGAVLLVSFSALFSFLPLLENKGGPEEAIKELSSGLGEIRTMLGEIGADAKDAKNASEDVATALTDKGIIPGASTMIERNIGGVWGQSDCINTYRFTLDPPGGKSRVLKVDSLKSGKGLDPYNGEFVFKEAADKFGGSDGFERSAMSTQEVKGRRPGYLVEFILEKAGSDEKLLWSNKSDEQADPTLIRCPDTEATQ